MPIISALNRLNNKASSHIDRFFSVIKEFFKKNFYLVIVLSVITIVVFGFELFNFNLTIDEEVHAINNGPVLDWIKQGRWGMYLLNKILLPYTVIPFFPLFLALIFHILSIILLVNVWGDYTKIEKIFIGSICISYPGIAYAYTFSTINYGIGFGFLCCALSLWFFAKCKGIRVFYAIIPALFAVSIYQGLIPALVAVYLVYLINQLLHNSDLTYKKFLAFVVIIIAAILLSELLQSLVLRIYGLSETSYVSNYFNFQTIKINTSVVVNNFLEIIEKVYLGDSSIYIIELISLTILLSVSIIGFIWRVMFSKVSALNKLLAFLLVIGLAIVPYLGGVLMNGFYAMRFLVSLSIVISGITALGLSIHSSLYKFIIFIIVIFSVSQFSQSANRLFGSSNLALEVDRIVGQQLIEKIDNAVNEAENPETIKYLEIIGYYERSATQLIPKVETFGASFFEWEEGNPWRVLYFLQTLGFDDLQGLPMERRILLIEFAEAMPNWPDEKSVQVVGDTVLVKFGPYSNFQKRKMCETIVSQSSSGMEITECISRQFQ